MRILMATALAAATSLAGTAVTTTSAFAQGGSYQASCRNVANLGNGHISAECADSSGRYRSSTIQASACNGDIGNQNGLLACNGAVAQGGAYVPDPRIDQRADPRRDRDRNDNVGTALGAGALGAIAGAFLGSNLYQGQQSYPTYGQQGYGDPRYDPRYAQGGWGYGYQRGQYVPISRRAEWLDRRIEEGVRRQTLSRREANNLDRQLQDLVNLERRYGSNGYSNWERTDLDRRFDSLASQIRFETRDNNNRPGSRSYDNRYGDDRYDRRY